MGPDCDEQLGSYFVNLNVCKKSSASFVVFLVTKSGVLLMEKFIIYILFSLSKNIFVNRSPGLLDGVIS